MLATKEDEKQALEILFSIEMLNISPIYMFRFYKDVVSVARLEEFRALKLSRYESFRALTFVGQIGRF